MEAILYTAAFAFFAVCLIHWRIQERRDRLARESDARATLWSDTQEWYRIESQHGQSRQTTRKQPNSHKVGSVEEGTARYEGSE